MTPGDFLATLEGLGIRLRIEGGRLAYQGPRHALHAGVMAGIKTFSQVFIEDWTCHRCGQVGRVFYGFPPFRHCLSCFKELGRGS